YSYNPTESDSWIWPRRLLIDATMFFDGASFPSVTSSTKRPSMSRARSCDCSSVPGRVALIILSSSPGAAVLVSGCAWLDEAFASDILASGWAELRFQLSHLVRLFHLLPNHRLEILRDP